MIFNRMQKAIQSLLIEIHNHPFNQQLGQGTLPLDKFIFYLTQDAIYLADFSRALSITAARLPDNPHLQQYIEFALGTIKAERELHFGYINSYIKEHQLVQKTLQEPSPACFMYTNYLLKMASLASVEEAVASLLPCFFIYSEVGKKMLTNQHPAHPYYHWIDLYSGEGFELSVLKAIEITNQLSIDCSPSLQNKMIAAFVRSTQLEWLFWQSAYEKEQWVINTPRYDRHSEVEWDNQQKC